MGNIIGLVERDKKVYSLARAYLLTIEGVTEELIDANIAPPKQRREKLSDLYCRLLESAQNAGMGPNVIGKSVGGLDNLGQKLLCNFDPQAVLKKYDGDWERVLVDITTNLNSRIRIGSRSLWPRFCKAIISGATFLTQFKTADEFYKWADFFDRDNRARSALPMLLAYEIDGIGFALACDFLKEIGYVNFGKPDVHLKKIFNALELCVKTDDYHVFKSIVRMAQNCNVEPFKIDKLFWRIGSGKFQVNGKDIGRRRDDFIKYAKARL